MGEMRTPEDVPPPFFFAELGGEQVRYLVLPLFLDEAGMTAKVDVKAGVGVMVRMHSDPKEASCVWDADASGGSGRIE